MPDSVADELRKQVLATLSQQLNPERVLQMSSDPVKAKRLSDITKEVAGQLSITTDELIKKVSSLYEINESYEVDNKKKTGSEWIATTFKNHLDGAFEHKDELKTNLLIICQVLSSEEDMKLFEIDLGIKAAFKYKIIEGAAHCTDGFLNRTTEIISPFKIDTNTIDGQLAVYRSTLVENAAKSTGALETHAFNQFIIFSQGLGILLEANEKDHYVGDVLPTAIVAEILKQYKENYIPSQIVANILQYMMNDNSKFNEEFIKDHANDKTGRDKYAATRAVLKDFLHIHGNLGDIDIFSYKENGIDVEKPDWVKISTLLVKSLNQFAFFDTEKLPVINLSKPTDSIQITLNYDERYPFSSLLEVKTSINQAFDDGFGEIDFAPIPFTYKGYPVAGNNNILSVIPSNMRDVVIKLLMQKIMDAQPPTKENLSSYHFVLFVLVQHSQADKEISQFLQNNMAEMLKSTTRIHDFLIVIPPELRARMFPIILNLKPELMNNITDFKEIVEVTVLLTPQQVTELFASDEMKNKLAKLIINPMSFVDAIKMIDSKYQTALCDAVKEVINTIIDKSSFDYILRNTPQPKRKMLLKYPVFRDQLVKKIKSSHDFNDVLLPLSPDEHTDLYNHMDQSLKGGIKSLVDTADDFRRIAFVLSRDNKLLTEFCAAAKSKLPSIVHSFDDFLGASRYLSDEQKTELFSSVKIDFVAGITTPYELLYVYEGLAQAQFTAICEDLAKKKPDFFSQPGVISQFFNAFGRCDAFAHVCDSLKQPLSHAIHSTNEVAILLHNRGNHGTLLLQTVAHRIPNIINSINAFVNVISNTNPRIPEQTKIIYDAVSMKLPSLIKSYNDLTKCFVMPEINKRDLILNANKFQAIFTDSQSPKSQAGAREATLHQIFNFDKCTIVVDYVNAVKSFDKSKLTLFAFGDPLKGIDASNTEAAFNIIIKRAANKDSDAVRALSIVFENKIKIERNPEPAVTSAPSQPSIP